MLRLLIKNKEKGKPLIDIDWSEVEAPELDLEDKSN